MIRRGFWLVAGAVLGITAYRKVTRLAHSLASGGFAGPSPVVRPVPVARPAPVGGPSRVGLASPGRLALGSMSSPAGRLRKLEGRQSRGGLATFVASARFARDVWTGMAEYWDLHRPALARNLRSRGDRISSGRRGGTGEGP
ncbi:MAG: hypothetical protein J2P28_21465, partial [Actinobacteria bacterium]|nr:hypothetical protein [Actinomycetota bacterium]